MKKTDLEAVIEGDFTSKPSIDPGIIEGEINRYSSVDFQKLGRTSDDSDESAIPLAGAVFTVYKANEDGTRGDIAIAKDGTKLENLVTNDEGKLCLAEALAIQKTETGVLFEVSSCGFGPFELMWLTDASGESGNVPGGETGDGSDGQLNDGSEDQLGSSDAATEEKTSSSGDKAGSSLPETSDSLTYVISALLVVVAVSATIGIVAFLRRRDI